MRLIDADNMRFSHGLNEDGILYVPYGEIKSAPTVEAVPVIHAKWEPVIRADGSADKRLVQCSICGATTGNCSKGNYCHRCGARMDGEA